MSKYKNLFNNSLIFAIGSFGSKFISFFMVPLYTYALTTTDYGIVDLITTSVNLMLPFVTLSIEQAVIRFVMDDTNINKKKEILSTALFFIMGLVFLVSFVGVIISNIFNLFSGYRTYFFIFLIVSSIQAVFSQYTRGIKKIKEFAINGIIQTVVIASLNVLLLIKFNLGINGYIISLIASNVISIIYMCFVINAKKVISFSKIDFSYLKRMLYYSVPLIPNYTMWWLVNNSTRYVILLFVGASGNGLFAVANKIPSLITMVTNIFSQAWQISAFEEYNSEDKSKFYSIVFEYYYSILFLLSSFIIMFCKPLITILVNSQYYSSWLIVPALCFAMIYQTLSSFVGSVYTASMNTKGVFFTSIIGAIVSVVINFLTIPFFGISSAGIGPLIGFALMTLMRIKDTKKLIEIKINKLKFNVNNIVLTLQIIMTYLLHNSSLILIIGIQAILFVIIVVSNKNIFVKLLSLKKR